MKEDTVLVKNEARIKWHPFSTQPSWHLVRCVLSWFHQGLRRCSKRWREKAYIVTSDGRPANARLIITGCHQFVWQVIATKKGHRAQFSRQKKSAFTRSRIRSIYAIYNNNNLHTLMPLNIGGSQAEPRSNVWCPRRPSDSLIRYLPMQYPTTIPPHPTSGRCMIVISSELSLFFLCPTSFWNFNSFDDLNTFLISSRFDCFGASSQGWDFFLSTSSHTSVPDNLLPSSLFLISGEMRRGRRAYPRYVHLIVSFVTSYLIILYLLYGRTYV